MGTRDRSTLLALFSGILVSGLFIGWYNKCFRVTCSDRFNISFRTDSDKKKKESINKTISNIEQIDTGDVNNQTREDRSLSNRKEDIYIKNIDKSPLELRKRFDNKGYVFVNNNLATVNTELNEFVELMRRYGLTMLNGCTDPDNCQCNFRHKRCRLFMTRIYSDHPGAHFYVPRCTGVVDISPSNKDIQNGTTIHEFVQLYQMKFSERVKDLINYVDYVANPDRNKHYVVDVTMIADPYDEYYRYEPESGGMYGQPLVDGEESLECLNNSREEIDEKDRANREKQREKHRCSLLWHQDRFVEAKTKQTHSYDIVALFVLNASNITPHSLMIGRVRDDVNITTLEDVQKNIITLSDTMIENGSSDTGYIIDQRKNIYHKHSDYEYIDRDSRRNVITIRLKYLR